VYGVWVSFIHFFFL